MLASESTKVSTSLWVEARIIMAKSWLFDKNVEKSILTLKEICYLLPPFPIQELRFIDSVVNEDIDD